ncbi:hypothetical protein VH441_00610 [Psychrobacter sp. HD31]|uniref:hypothetical protein n=1 Tax=Psychrobacter sp. HD31 TaxID=3112003 RepID=UPI003DA22D73
MNTNTTSTTISSIDLPKSITSLNDLSDFECVLDGDYIQYYAVNQTGNPVAPFGVTGIPLTLEQAKQTCLALQADKPQYGWQVEQCTIHIGCITGFEHLHPSRQCDQYRLSHSTLNTTAEQRRNRYKKRKRHYQKRRLSRYGRR